MRCLCREEPRLLVAPAQALAGEEFGSDIDRAQAAADAAKGPVGDAGHGRAGRPAPADDVPQGLDALLLRLCPIHVALPAIISM